MRKAVMERRAWGGAVLSRWPVIVLDASPARMCWATTPGTSRLLPAAQTVERVTEVELSVSTGDTWLATASAPPGRPRALILESVLPVEGRGRGRLAFVELPVDVAASPGRLWHDPLDTVAARLDDVGIPKPIVARVQSGLRDLALRIEERAWPFDGWLEGHAGRLARRIAA